MAKTRLLFVNHATTIGGGGAGDDCRRAFGAAGVGRRGEEHLPLTARGARVAGAALG